MIELKKSSITVPHWYHVGSNAWHTRPEGYYFYPEGEFIDGSVKCRGPYSTEQDAKDAENLWEESHS